MKLMFNCNMRWRRCYVSPLNCGYFNRKRCRWATRNLYTRCWTQRVSIGCDPTLLALLQHRLTFFVLPRSSFEFAASSLLACLVCESHFISCSHWLQTFQNYALFVNSCAPLCLAELPLFWHFISFELFANGSILF